MLFDQSVVQGGWPKLLPLTVRKERARYTPQTRMGGNKRLCGCPREKRFLGYPRQPGRRRNLPKRINRPSRNRFLERSRFTLGLCSDECKMRVVCEIPVD